MSENAIPQPTDEFQVYMTWPMPLVEQALQEFKARMYGGAEPDELAAGLRCLDFITRRTDLSDDFRVFLDAAIDEAEMRIALMRAQSEDEESQARRRRSLHVAMEGSLRHINNVLARARMMDADEIIEHIHKRAST